MVSQSKIIKTNSQNESFHPPFMPYICVASTYMCVIYLQMKEEVEKREAKIKSSYEHICNVESEIRLDFVGARFEMYAR